MMVLCQSHRHDFQGPHALGKVKIDNICYWCFLYFSLYTFFPLLASLCLYTQGPKKNKIYSDCLQAGVEGGFLSWSSPSKNGLQVQTTPALLSLCN